MWPAAPLFAVGWPLTRVITTELFGRRRRVEEGVWSPDTSPPCKVGLGRAATHKTATPRMQNVLDMLRQDYHWFCFFFPKQTKCVNCLSLGYSNGSVQQPWNFSEGKKPTKQKDYLNKNLLFSTFHIQYWISYRGPHHWTCRVIYRPPESKTLELKLKLIIMGTLLGRGHTWPH